MKIAQIAPLYESVPPKLYGGTERVVHFLTEELVRLGHDVTLFASGDSCSSARLVRCCDRALRLNPAVVDPIPHHLAMLEEVRRRAHSFDVLHFHIDLLHFPLLRHLGCNSVTTLHGRLDCPDLARFYGTFSDAPLVSISDDQRRALPPVNWLGTIYHGLPASLLPLHPAPSRDYLAFLGRISPEKGPDRAIEIAARTGLPLKIAAKVDRNDRDYWHEVIAPMIAAHPQVTFVGEIGEADKAEFLGNARALLFPIDWPEPFGLVMIEAIACGTPVVAFRRGSVPEVVDDGVSGFVVDTVDEAAAAVERIGHLDRGAIRRCFERRFTAERMARGYLEIYEDLTALRQPEMLTRPLADAEPAHALI